MQRTVSFRRYLIRRLLEAIPLIFIVIIVNFSIIHLAPGDPMWMFVGEHEPDPEWFQQQRARWGLDKPFYEQLATYVLNVLQGDLGYSIYYGRPVTEVLLDRIPKTFLIMGTKMLIFPILGVLLGVISSRKPYSKADNLSTLLSLIGYSMPVFWLAQMLIITFSIDLGWFPAQGMTSIRTNLQGIPLVLDILRHLFLPLIAAGMFDLAVAARLTRGSMLETLRADYIITAKSKGIRERTVLYKHALRNALLPVITSIGMSFGWILTGSLITEVVFSWPGVGLLMIQAVYSRDYPILLGILMLTSIMVILANLVTDLIYAVLDPRIRY